MLCNQVKQVFRKYRRSNGNKDDEKCMESVTVNAEYCCRSNARTTSVITDPVVSECRT
ncbi:MAG: hypothetical protein ACLTLE_06830 [Lachnospiraceae bacterium]